MLIFLGVVSVVSKVFCWIFYPPQKKCLKKPDVNSTWTSHILFFMPWVVQKKMAHVARYISAFGPWVQLVVRKPGLKNAGCLVVGLPGLGCVYILGVVPSQDASDHWE